MGFTLIEVVVVIGIIAILTTIAYASLTQIRAKSRDQKRVADVHEIQLALEYFFNKNGQYPEMIWPATPTEESVSLKSFLGSEPKAPTSGEIYSYIPIKETSEATRCSSYHLWTRLELNSSALDSKKGYDSTGKIICGDTAQDSWKIKASLDEKVYDLRP